MSKVLIEIDTESSEMSVEVNGKKINNVVSLSAGLYRYPEEDGSMKMKCGVDICTETEDENDVKTRTYICANKKDFKGKPVNIEGFVLDEIKANESSKEEIVKKQIANIFNKRS